MSDSIHDCVPLSFTAQKLMINDSVSDFVLNEVSWCAHLKNKAGFKTPVFVSETRKTSFRALWLIQ